MGDTYTCGCSHSPLSWGLQDLLGQSHHWLSLRLVSALFRTGGWSRWWQEISSKQYFYDSLILCWIWKFFLALKLQLDLLPQEKKKKTKKIYAFPFQVKLANQCVFSHILRLPWLTLPFSVRFFVGNHLFQILLQLAPRTNQKHPCGAQELDHFKNEASSASSVVCTRHA